MKLGLVAPVMVLLVGCSQVDTHRLVTEGGVYVGDVFNIRHSQDGCEFQAATLVYDAKGALKEVRAAELSGITCAAIHAGARVGAAGVLGANFPRNVGDNTSIDNTNQQAQGQGQQQRQIATGGSAAGGLATSHSSSMSTATSGGAMPPPMD